MRPVDLVVRMYARRLSDGSWRAVCVDYDLEAAGATYEAAMASLDDAVVGYLETVFDTKDTGSIPALLRRRAPLREWFSFSLPFLAPMFIIAGPLGAIIFLVISLNTIIGLLVGLGAAATISAARRRIQRLFRPLIEKYIRTRETVLPMTLAAHGQA